MKILVKGVVELATLGGVLFGIAGRVDWPAAWLVILLFTGHLVLSGWWLFRHDPELLKERLTTASNVPHWDRRIARANRIMLLIFLATAALDGAQNWPPPGRGAKLRKANVPVGSGCTSQNCVIGAPLTPTAPTTCPFSLIGRPLPTLRRAQPWGCRSGSRWIKSTKSWAGTPNRAVYALIEHETRAGRGARGSDIVRRWRWTPSRSPAPTAGRRSRCRSKRMCAGRSSRTARCAAIPGSSA